MLTFEIGALDFSPVFPGIAPRIALQETIELARLLEPSGYSRFWLGEHHSAHIAHGSPETLVPIIAGMTDRIRVGTGGILLARYSPQKVAETFRLLHALFPGRIDLGIARGNTTHTMTGQDFESAVSDLLDYLGDLKQNQVSPGGVPAPPVWILGSKTKSMEIAARAGTHFCFAQFLAAPESDVARVISDYRARFSCGALQEPVCAIALAGICAPTEQAARSLFPANAPYSVSQTLVGSPRMWARKLQDLRKQTGIRSYMFLDMCQSFEARLESYRLLAEASLG